MGSQRNYRFGNFTRGATGRPAAESVRQMFTFAPPDHGWVPALRIALTTALPLTLLLIFGKTEYTMFASFGAFTAIYGKNTAWRNRLFEQSVAGLLIFLCILLGLILTVHRVPDWLVIPISSCVSAACASLVLYLGLRPPGSLFFIFGVGAVGILPFTANPYFAVSIMAGSALWAVLLGLLWGLFGEGRNTAAMPAAVRSSIGWVRILEQGAVYCGTSMVAGYIGVLIGSPHSYWAMVAASSALAMPSASARYRRAIERVAGTFFGVLTAAFFISMNPSPAHLVVMMVAAQFIGQNYIRRNYAFSMFFITPQALFMIHMVHPLTTNEVLTDRLLETVIGAVVGMLAVFLTRSPEKVGTDTVATPVLRVARKFRR